MIIVRKPADSYVNYSSVINRSFMPFPISSSSSDTLSTSSNSSESTELLPTSSTEVLSTSSSTEVLGCCTNDFDGDGAITAIDQLMYKAYLEVTAVNLRPVCLKYRQRTTHM